MLRLDHLAVCAGRLEEGVEAIEAALGVRMAPGGKHPHMSTHNRLLGAGDIYLEAIAIDPEAPPPGRSRWFGLDDFAGPPRLAAWIAACDDIGAAIAACPPGYGPPVDLARGDYRWRMAAGATPLADAFPPLIEWQGARHPTQSLPDAGVRLQRLEIAHPDAPALAAALAGLFSDPRVEILSGPAKALRASFATPHGLRYLE